ncbi:MAG: chemotaxis protein CheC [Ignavibacteriales bacterium]|nr:chemotaxis protein CheC [Ignavibacteriales bacterium]
MIGNSATSLSSMFGVPIDISTPEVRMLEPGGSFTLSDIIYQQTNLWQ